MCCQVARLEGCLATILNEPEEREKEDQFAGEPSLFEYEGALGVVIVFPWQEQESVRVRDGHKEDERRRYPPALAAEFFMIELILVHFEDDGVQRAVSRAVMEGG